MERDYKIDGLKSLMIFLVVLGHIHGYNDYGLRVTQLIFSFHMPVFVFLSGLLTSINPNKEKRWKWLKQTFLLFVFAQAAHVLLGLAMGETISWKVLICPEFAMWYLLCLMYWRISVWALFKNTNEITLLCCSFVLAILSGIIPVDYEFSFQRAFAFYPFFVLGIVFKKRNLMTKIEKVPVGYAITVLIIGLIVAYLLPWGSYMPKFHYLSWTKPIIRIIQTSLALCLCLSIIRLSRNRVVEKMTFLGQYSLWIYIGHTFVIRLYDKCFSLRLDLIGAIIMALLICFGFGLLAYGYAQLKRNKKLKAPSK